MGVTPPGNYPHPDDHTRRTTNTPGFKPLSTYFTEFKKIRCAESASQFRCTTPFAILPWLRLLNLQFKAANGRNELCPYDNVSKQRTYGWFPETVWSKPFKCCDCSAAQVSENCDLVVGDGQGSLVLNQNARDTHVIGNTWVRFWIQSSYWL